MGQGTAEAVTHIEENRARLDEEVTELQRRLPPVVEQAKRRTTQALCITGGTLIAMGGVAVLVRGRRARKRRRAIPEITGELTDAVRQAVGEAAGSLRRGHDLPAPVDRLARRVAA